jgi:hypothetical protein
MEVALNVGLPSFCMIEVALMVRLLKFSVTEVMLPKTYRSRSLLFRPARLTGGMARFL